jgi:hypothetical protein
MEQSQRAWNLLAESVGTFAGHGVNHEGEKFAGKLSLKLAMPGKLLSLLSSATGVSGEVFHEEVSWIGRDMTGTLTLFVSSNNHPGVTPHLFDRIEESPDANKIIFKFGDIQDKNSFREEVTLALHSDGSLAHHYAWGLPGGSFESRSGSRMQRTPQ